MSWLEDDEGGNDLAAQRVGLADHRRLRDRGVLHEGAFYLEGPDPVPGAGDDVVGAAAEVEEVVGIPAGGVTGQVIAADDPLAGPLARLVVAPEPVERGPRDVQPDLPLLAGAELVALLVDDHRVD